VFRLHKDVTKAQANADRLPFDPKLPIYAQRPTLRNGKPGERLLIDNTQYLKPETRNRVFESLHDTKQVNAISVRSVVSIRSYLGLPENASNKQVMRAFKIRGAKDTQGRKTLIQGFADQAQRVGGSVANMSVLTRMTDFSPRADIGLSLSDINAKIRQKHEPHSNKPADQFLVQTIPGQYDNFSQPKRQTAKAKRTSLKRK
jgi:hypothetical protein